MKILAVVQTYLLLAWWAFACVADLHWFPPPAHREGAFSNAATFNVILAIFVASTWAFAFFRDRLK